MTARLAERAPRSTESPTMVRYRLSKRLKVLVDHVDYFDAAGADTTAARNEIRRTLAAMALLDDLAAPPNDTTREIST